MRLIRESHPKARRRHTCTGCLCKNIAPGQRYYAQTWADQGEIDTIKLCSLCVKKLEAVDWFPGDTWAEGELRYLTLDGEWL